MTANEEMKRRRYRIRIKRIRDQHKLPHLTTLQTDDLIERLMLIPGTIDCIDLRTVVRLYCREMKCPLEGPIYD
jgi:hypothetical protein